MKRRKAIPQYHTIKRTSWRSRRQYKILAAELAATTDRDFERAILPFVRLAFPEMVSPPALGHYDKQGIDHLCWGTPPTLSIVVQCKGFKTDRPGSDQARQCLKSIEKFRKSGLSTQRYLLVHNSDGAPSDFAITVREQLDRLQSGGVANSAELWSRHDLLHAAFDAMQVGMQKYLHAQATREAEKLVSEELTVTDVPTRVSRFRADQFKIRDITVESESIRDPAELLLSVEAGEVCVLLGGFGFGKTMTARRATAQAPGWSYLAGAAISRQSKSAKELLETLVDLSALLADFPEVDQPAIRRVALPVLERLFKQETPGLGLLIDGLDESPYLTHEGGLQWLLNNLRGLSVPVVLTTRSEFWHTHLTDFMSAFGIPTKQDQYRYVQGRLVELLEWNDVTIAELIRRNIAQPIAESARANLKKLVEIIDSGQYADYYGDIPKRPLFLKMVIESVMEHGPKATSKALLFEEWVALKVIRDRHEPQRVGGDRVPIARNALTIEDSLEVSFRAMEVAAAAMTTTEDKVVHLLPYCAFDDLARRDGRLKELTDPAALALNSLLELYGTRRVGEPVHLRFGHRAYQEYFVARHAHSHPHEYEGKTLPSSVAAWQDELNKL